MYHNADTSCNASLYRSKLNLFQNWFLKDWRGVVNLEICHSVGVGNHDAAILTPAWWIALLPDFVLSDRYVHSSVSMRLWYLDQSNKVCHFLRWQTVGTLLAYLGQSEGVFSSTVLTPKSNIYYFWIDILSQINSVTASLSDPGHGRELLFRGLKIIFF